jgi:6-pyruvoyltetrahydropterin/6-carboxytetrahydropterin synthase
VFHVGVSDHILVAHSLRGDTFGPAQRLHGATYEVRAELFAADLDPDQIVIDIGFFQGALQQSIAPLNYQNLDSLPELEGENTTTEFLARWIHGQLAARLGGRSGARLRITLVESPNAWAGYEEALNPP